MPFLSARLSAAGVAASMTLALTIPCITDAQAQNRPVVAQRDAPVQAGVVGAVDDGHATPADLLVEPVAGDMGPHAEVAGRRGSLLTHRASRIPLQISWCRRGTGPKPPVTRS